MRKTFLLFFSFSFLCTLSFAADRSWDFTNWSEETLGNLAADGANWKAASTTRFENAILFDANIVIQANSIPVKELEGLTFNALAAGKFRVDYGEPEGDAVDTKRIILNGGKLSINVPDCNVGDIITVVYKTASGTGDVRGISMPSEIATLYEGEATSGVKSTVKFQVVTAGTVAVTTDGGLQFFSLSVQGATVLEPTVSLQSGNAEQSVFADQSISPIQYKFAGLATSATVTWDGGATPDGITVATEGDIVTISGTPTAVGEYKYSITATDGTATSQALTGVITVKEVVAGKKMIAYVVRDSPATDEGEKTIIAKLSESYEVVTILAATSGVDYSPYAAIVMSALPGSTATGLLELKNFTKPFVNLKPWMFIEGNGRWDWGTPANVEAASLEEIINTVVVANASHAIFNGMSLTDGAEIVMATNSSTKNRVLIPIVAWKESNEANVTALATVKGSDQEGKIVIGEIAVGSTMSGAAINHKNVFIGVSEAAGEYFTADYLAIVKNAVDYVIDDNVSIDSEKADDAAKVEVAAEYYDLTGRAISGAPKGIVIKKSIYEDGSFSFGKAYIK